MSKKPNRLVILSLVPVFIVGFIFLCFIEALFPAENYRNE